jgi:MFS family permease
MAPELISQDGRWWWDGTQWRSRVVEGHLDYFWFMTTPDWVKRILLTGLIGLIPIVGTINLYGWTLVATDMVRRKWRELPPAGFQYLERGVPPFVVGFVWAVVVFTAFGLMLVVALLLAFSGRGRLIVLAVAIALVMVLLFVVWWLVTLYLYAALLIGSDRLGIGQAINPIRLLRLARANEQISLRVAGIYLLASLAIAAVGTVAGFVIPFASLLASIALPAVFAILVPSLAAFQVDAEPAGLVTQSR